MSVRRDRFTFFAVLVAVGVAVLGYVRLGDLYPTAGRSDTDSNEQPDLAAEGGEDGGAEGGRMDAEEEAGHSEAPGSSSPGSSDPEE